MWEQALTAFARRLVRRGSLEITFPTGRRITLGDGSGPRLTMQIIDPALPRRLCLMPELAMGEGYMDGGLTIGDDDLHGVLTLLLANGAALNSLPLWQRPVGSARRWLRGFAQWNTARRSRANVAHHYDLSGALYDLFLDKDRQYSCAYFRDPEMTLDQAQAAKKAHIAAKLLLRPGMHVLDIGCGWGGMALTLARDHGVRVTGVTLSEEQWTVARARAKDEGLSDRVNFQLMDYRDVQGPFDRIVSVGMFEHVGVPHYRTYFAKVRDLLAPDGVALIHTIGRTMPPRYTSPWITKYIFPGGYSPALSEIMTAIENEDLIQTDIEILRLHYARTLRLWHDRFLAREDEARALYDERFCRMWRFYLTVSELAFVHSRHAVFQIQLVRNQTAVPLTRDYLYPVADQASIQAHAAE